MYDLLGNNEREMFAYYSVPFFLVDIMLFFPWG